MSPATPSRHDPGSGTWRRFTVLLLLLAVVAALALSGRLESLEHVLVAQLEACGDLAPLALVVVYALATALALPVFPLDLAAGAHFGFWAGLGWVQVAATGAALVGYQLGHVLGRGLFERALARRPWLREAVLDAVAEDGNRIVFLARLSPVLSFSLLSGLFGAARVPLRGYLLATFFGVLPGSVLFVHAGRVATDLSARDTTTPEALGMRLAGFAATVVAVLLVTRRAQRSLTRRLELAHGSPAVSESRARGR